MTIRHGTLADAPSLARVHVDTWRATYRGMVPDEYLDAMSYDSSTTMSERLLASSGPRKATFVAEDEKGVIVGFAGVGPVRDEMDGIDGELYTIYLRPDAQGEGIGTMLFDAVTTFLAGEGMRGMLVWVLTDNPSRRFYEARGGVELSRKMIRVGGAELEEIGYGWRLLG